MLVIAVCYYHPRAHVSTSRQFFVQLLFIFSLLLFFVRPPLYNNITLHTLNVMNDSYTAAHENHARNIRSITPVLRSYNYAQRSVFYFFAVSDATFSIDPIASIRVPRKQSHGRRRSLHDAPRSDYVTILGCSTCASTRCPPTRVDTRLCVLCVAAPGHRMIFFPVRVPIRRLRS